MARVVNCGFELNSNSAGIEVTAASSPSPTVQGTTVRSGNHAAQISSLSSGQAKGFRWNFLTTAGNGPWFGRTYYRVATAPSAENCIVQFNDTNAFTTPIAYITIDNSRVLRLYDEDGQIGSASSAIPADDFAHRIEIKVNRTGAAGAHEVRGYLDGTEFAGSATRDLSAGVLTFNVGGNLLLEAQTAGNWYFDDVAVNDNTGSYQNDLPGEGELIILRPSGAGDSAAWARGGTDSGANWSQLEEKPPNDITDYVSSNTLDQIDYYALEDTPAAMGSTDIINGVFPGARFSVSSATGADPDITLGLLVSGNSDETAAIDVSNTTWGTNANDGVRVNYPALANNSNYEQPGGSSAWTKSALDSTQYRLREAATDTHFAQVSAVWVYVDHKPAGGTQFTQDTSGAMTPAGAMATQTQAPKTGALTPAGALAKQAQVAKTGSIGPTGAIAKSLARLLSGAITPAGALTSLKVATKVLTGAVSFAGGLAGKAGKSLTGTIAPAGALVKRLQRALIGAIGPGGVLAGSKVAVKVLTGAVSFAGAMTKTAQKALGGSATPAGAITKRAQKTLQAVVTFAGGLTKQARKALAAVLSAAGALVRDLISGGTGIPLEGVIATLSEPAIPTAVISWTVPWGVTSEVAIPVAIIEEAL